MFDPELNKNMFNTFLEVVILVLLIWLIMFWS